MTRVAAAAGALAFAVSGSSAAPVVRVTDWNNGRTVSVRTGQRLQLVLSNTHWTIRNSSDVTVLRLQGPARTAPASGCFGGTSTGCGTTTATFLSLAPGSALVTATQRSCAKCVAVVARYSLRVVVR